MIAAGLSVTGPAVANVCREAMPAYEKHYRIPRNLLGAIGLTESGYVDPATKTFGPWPWTVYAEGKGRYHANKEAAIADVQAAKRRGVRNIDVGCMQINLKYHPHAFHNLEQAFDPTTNVAYAAKYLADLKRQHKSWNIAIGRYHSADQGVFRPLQEEGL